MHLLTVFLLLLPARAFSAPQPNPVITTNYEEDIDRVKTTNVVDNKVLEEDMDLVKAVNVADIEVLEEDMDLVKTVNVANIEVLEDVDLMKTVQVADIEVLEDVDLLETVQVADIEVLEENVDLVKAVNVDDIEVVEEDMDLAKSVNVADIEVLEDFEGEDKVNIEKVTDNEELERLREYILVRFWQEAELEKQKALHNEMVGEEVHELLTNIQKMTLNLLVGHPAFPVDK